MLMKVEKNNSKISISIEVIRYITFYYFTIAIILTVGQVLYEYYSIKNNIHSSIADLSLSFNDSLTNSLWEFNDNQTNTILTGILESPSTLGVKLTDPKGIVTHNLGKTDDDKIAKNRNIKNLFNPNALFVFKTELIKKIDSNRQQKVGTLIIYSGNQVILGQLSRIIFYIIFNSIIKTISLWAILIIFFNTKIKRPLQNLVKSILNIDPHNPKPIRLYDDSENTVEVAEIITSFNGLVEELNNFKDILEAIIDNKTELIKEKNIEVRKLVTKLEQAQNQIVNQEKLNSLGLVSAGIAHELKNPLNISKNTVLILDSILKIDSDKILDISRFSEHDLKQTPKLIKILIDSNDRMETIIRNMLLQSRTENTKPILINISSFIQMNIRVVQKSLKDRAATETKVILNLDDTINIKVFVSELGRLLVNVFENAFFALNEKIAKTDDITFTPKLEISIKKLDTGDVSISIKDNGTGIPQNLKDKILEPFFTTKPTGIGTGLGLYLSYEIIKKHHGELIINSELDQYTEILITLPQNLEEYYS